MVKINEIAKTIEREMKLYSQAVEADVEKSKKESATDLVKDLEKVSPKDTGDYEKGWRIKKSKKKLIVHNATDYQLTHLLEHGHAKIGGGRVSAKVHIRPAENRAVNSFLNKIERAIKQ